MIETPFFWDDDMFVVYCAWAIGNTLIMKNLLKNSRKHKKNEKDNFTVNS